MSMESRRVKCSGVPYRQGWIEVAPNIHAAYVNIESWSVVQDVDMSLPSTALTSLSDAAVTGNVEVELTIAQAKELLAALQVAIKAVEHAGA